MKKFIVSTGQHFSKRVWFRFFPFWHFSKPYLKPSSLHCSFIVDESWFVKPKTNWTQWNKIIGFSRGIHDNFSIRLCFAHTDDDMICFSIYIYEENQINYYTAIEALEKENTDARRVVHTNFYISKNKKAKKIKLILKLNHPDTPTLIYWNIRNIYKNLLVNEVSGTIPLKYRYFKKINLLSKTQQSLPSFGYLLYPYFGGSKPAPAPWSVVFDKIKLS